MKAVSKFYVESFLKNQTFFAPIIIIFLQSHQLSLQEIFWVFTIGSAVNFLIEIPTGIIADLFGKRKSIILSKLIAVFAFISFGFSYNFLTFVLSNILLVIANSFRSGTETAYIYDYLEQHKNEPTYTEVKGKQKFWARIGEAESTAIGGLIASFYGYQWAFFLAAIPSFAAFIVATTFPHIDETKVKNKIKESLQLAQGALVELFGKKDVLRITLNISLFATAVIALETFTQPTMQQAGIPIEWFGFIYSASLVITALFVRYAYIFENKFGRIKTSNTISLIAAPIALLLAIFSPSLWIVPLFFIIIITQNLRSPIVNTEFHAHIKSFNRATMGSILELTKNAGSVVLLPIIGFVTGRYGMNSAFFVLAILFLFTSVFFSLPTGHMRSKTINT